MQIILCLLPSVYEFQNDIPYDVGIRLFYPQKISSEVIYLLKDISGKCFESGSALVLVGWIRIKEGKNDPQK
jgi:hypothetical protein